MEIIVTTAQQQQRNQITLLDVVSILPVVARCFQSAATTADCSDSVASKKFQTGRQSFVEERESLFSDRRAVLA
jgi:hypothetical protein